MSDALPLPPVVDPADWEVAVASLREEEKAHTRRGDALAAARRRLPMTAVRSDYEFMGEHGPATLLDLFDGRSQLIVYHFMFGPDADAGCEGCSWVTDAMSHPAHLRARGVTMVLVSRAPIDKLLAYRDRMGWDMPWFSSHGSPFNADMGATIDDGENHGLSVFLRSGDDVFRTYFTTDRGIEHFGSHWTYLDATPYGRQETWEDSPAGWPQVAPYISDRRHDEYE